MATNYPQYLLTTAFAVDGDKTIPPATSQEAGTGRFSQAKGWTDVNSTPINEGGIPPYREDFNGLLFMLSQFALWQQQGGLMEYSASLDYEVGNEVLQNGTKYRCIQSNGPSSQAVAPGTDREVWRNLDITVPAGAVVPFCNVTLGGTENRNPVFWGATQADTGWVLCDGGNDGYGGLTPNLIDRFICGSDVDGAGLTGGSATIEIPSLSVNGTVGGTALTVAQLPAHTHSGTTASAGGHTHTRGTMNITGEFGGLESYDYVVATGCFYKSRKGVIGIGDSDTDNWAIGMDASSSWTGETSTSGQHTHTVSISSTGSGQTHTHTLTANAAISGVSNEPPFYTLAYFLRLPE